MKTKVRDTSIKAYHEIYDLGQRQRLILNLIASNPDKTDRELCKIMGVTDPNFIRPRRKELLDKSFIIESGKRVCTVTGKTCYIWRVTELTLF